MLDFRITPRKCVADHDAVRPFVQMSGIKSFMHPNTCLGQKGGHRGVNVRVRAGYAIALRLKCSRSRGHCGAADAYEVNMISFLNHPNSMTQTSPKNQVGFVDPPKNSCLGPVFSTVSFFPRMKKFVRKLLGSLFFLDLKLKAPVNPCASGWQR